jgi:NADPH-dependent 2,4-dienoyl-CoA reductase/sulfur reductase-like enzyme
MNKLHVKYLLVGGGLAAGSAAEAIRRLDPRGSAMLIGQEVNRPYHRPHLSKGYLKGEISKTDLIAEPVGWFVERDIALRTGRRVANIDIARHAAALDSGEEIAYDKLLIATGALPKPLKVPGADLPNVFSLRNLHDADRLTNAIEKAKHEGHKHRRGRGRATIVGAGTLGVELAATLTQLNITVDLVTLHDRPWRKFAGDVTGKFIGRYLEYHDVTLHMNTRVERFDGDGRVQHVRFAENDSIATDFVLIAIGTVANREIIRGTEITAEKAILVDERCRTSVPDVYAAGDCCAIYDPLFAKHRVIPHWDHARYTGSIAGTNMAGGDESYNVVNIFDSRVFDIKMTAFGEGRLVDHRILRGTPSIENPEMIEFGVGADGRLVQILALGHSQDLRQLNEMMLKRFDVTGVEEVLKDPTAPLPG